ncbi:MAG: ABC transporter ATP-binding protein [Desulfomonile tiedjei]|nr:ABC transporter ATP-binding protein [Desulfomonile tiedjei]
MLEVTNLHVYYDKVHVLKGISLTIRDGECVTLLGANGAGKSTLINTICGLVSTAAGSIKLDGTDISSVPAHDIVRLGISQVPEGRQIFANMSVTDNLRLGAYTRTSGATKGQIAEDMDRIFDMFPRLNERRTQLSGTLSGGEQQMLAIGRALMSRPKVLLLDEPSLGLAPLVVQFIFQTISRLREEGRLSVMMVEQNARAALQIAERAYILETGKIIMEDVSSALINNPEVQKAFLGGGMR